MIPADNSRWIGNMNTRIFLIGFMGSGKTTQGSRLARQIGYRFIDMDQLIEETAGMTVPEIFNDHGEKVFRKWERDILLEQCKGEQLVISTGGGAPCHSDMMDLMNTHGTTIYLEMSPAALRDRLIHSRTERPLVKGKSPEELLDFISKLLKEREEYYKRASLIVNGVDLKIEELTRLLKKSSLQ
jgi:shikimate kinase